jgi:hypothetical protein
MNPPCLSVLLSVRKAFNGAVYIINLISTVMLLMRVIIFRAMHVFVHWWNLVAFFYADQSRM